MLTVTVHKRSTNPQTPAPPTKYEMTPWLKPFLPSLIVPQQNTEAVWGGGGGSVRVYCQEISSDFGSKKLSGLSYQFLYFEIIIYLKLMLAL